MKGRFTGSEECLEAAKYIQDQFLGCGLKPLFDDTYKQTFPFISGVEFNGENSVELNINGETTSLKLSDDFTPASFLTMFLQNPN